MTDQTQSITQTHTETVEKISEVKSFEGYVKTYRHHSNVCQHPMTFAVYLPPQVRENNRVPVAFWLSGLTCTHENFIIKAGALRIAAELGLALVSPDTSPRNTGLAGEDDEWDFGSGAGFYVNATQPPWSRHYHMYDYIVKELPQLVSALCPVDLNRMSILGHSMGGHGALVIGLSNPGQFRAVSAFAPICAPMHCPWGEKAFSRYLGDDREQWAQYDATALIEQGGTTFDKPILIDQGEADAFLEEQLKPELLEAACKKAGVPLELRYHPGYDHSYFFIATFIEDHLRFHKARLA